MAGASLFNKKFLFENESRGTQRKPIQISPAAEQPKSKARIDSHTVKTSERSGSLGYDGAKKVTGRKRNIVVDTLGLLLVGVVTVASMDDGQAACLAMRQLTAKKYPCRSVIWADSKYHNFDSEHGSNVKRKSNES